MCKILIWEKFEKESDCEILLEEVYELGIQIINEFKSGEHKKNKKVGGSETVYRRHYKDEYRVIFSHKDNSLIFYYVKTKVNKEFFYRKATELESRYLNLEEIDFSWVKEVKKSLDKMVINRVNIEKKTSFMDLFYNYFKCKLTIKHPKLDKTFHELRYYPKHINILIEILSRDNSEQNIKTILGVSSTQLRKVLDKKINKIFENE
ncbi:hypothetical protein JXR93_09215 [bacterium]|nr:hypothetical protein [bacterium]